MQEDQQEFDSPIEWFTVKQTSLHLIDATLLAMRRRLEEQMRDLTPHHHAEAWPYSPEELRNSHLGRALMTIAAYVDHSIVSPTQVERAIKRAQRILFGNGLAEGSPLPPAFHKTDLGRLFHTASTRLYQKELLTAQAAYDLLGVSRQTLYNRLYKGKLTPIYWNGDAHDLRFLRREIEDWKTQREQRSLHEE